jgi:hypothetical protein
MRFFNHANNGVVSRRRLAETAGIDLSKVIADRAENNSLLDFAQGRYEPLNLGVRRAHDIKRQTLSRLMPDAGQSSQFVD